MNTPDPALQAVLFDLDGTLADTAADLARALNRVLEHEGRAPLSMASIRPTVSLGGLAMVRMAFPGEDEEMTARCHRLLLDYYGERVAAETVLFPGMASLLDAVEGAGLDWGIVTNKTSRFTLPIVEALGLTARARCVVCGDTTPHAKPHPAPLLHACTLLAADPARVIYVGDAHRDVEAGRQAGMRTVVARYGYLEDGADLEDWGADHLIDQPGDLAPLLGL